MEVRSSTGCTPLCNQEPARGRFFAPIQVLIVAELSTCKETIRALLDLQDLGHIRIIGRVDSEVDALRAMTVLLPDLIILDHQIQGMSALSASSLLASHFPATKLLLFTEEDSAQLREACLTCGVQVIISKRTLRADMAAAVDQICGFTDTGYKLLEPEDWGSKHPLRYASLN